MKYESLDSRTGFEVGEVVELSDEVLNSTPFNVYLEKVEDESGKKKPAKKSVVGDLDGDGDFDSDDKSIAAKTLRKKLK